MRGVGSYQSDALQNIIGSIEATTKFFAASGALRVKSITGNVASGTQAGDGTQGIMLDASNAPGVRTSVETRGPNVATLPVILI